jgi:hypothetical protein
MSKNVTINNHAKVNIPPLSPKSTKLYEEAIRYYELKKSMGKSWMKETDKVKILIFIKINFFKRFILLIEIG